MEFPILKKNWAIFGTLSIEQKNNTINMKIFSRNLLDSFRTINIVTPDSIHILKLSLSVLGYRNSFDVANKILLMLQIITNGIENQEFLFNENLYPNNLNLSHRAIYAAPDLNDIMKILRNIKQIHERLRDDPFQKLNNVVNILRKAIEITFHSKMESDQKKKMTILFNSIFHHHVSEDSIIFGDNEEFQELFCSYCDESKLPKSSIFYERCYLFYLLLKQTSVKEKANIVLIYGKQTKTRLIQAVSEISARINGKISHII